MLLAIKKIISNRKIILSIYILFSLAATIPSLKGSKQFEDDGKEYTKYNNYSIFERSFEHLKKQSGSICSLSWWSLGYLQIHAFLLRFFWDVLHHAWLARIESLESPQFTCIIGCYLLPAKGKWLSKRIGITYRSYRVDYFNAKPSIERINCRFACFFFWFIGAWKDILGHSSDYVFHIYKIIWNRRLNPFRFLSSKMEKCYLFIHVGTYPFTTSTINYWCHSVYKTAEQLFQYVEERSW